MTAPCCAVRPRRRLPSLPGALARRLLLLPVLLVILLPALVPLSTQAAPQFWLPTPPGEGWRIIQGYGCGTHSGYDRYSLDIVSNNGETRGAPVRAAADGTVWAWSGSSGTLIIDHGGGFKSMYTHMASHSVGQGQFVARGTVIGTVGNVGAEWTVPHLHFTLFLSGGGYSLGNSVPLSFAEGYDLPELGGCNQHGGEVLVSANGLPDADPPTIEFGGGVEPKRWYNSDQRIDFKIGDDLAVRGFSQTWDREPDGEQPMFEGAREGYVQTEWAGEGMHSLFVRAWDASGKQTLVSFGPVGLDKTPPGEVKPGLHAAAQPAAPDGSLTLTWQPAPDSGGSGVVGYRLYLGPDPQGTGEWYESKTEVAVKLATGSFFFRAQAVDAAGNAGPWTTLTQLTQGTAAAPTASAPPTPSAVPDASAAPTAAPPTPTAPTEVPTSAPTDSPPPSPMAAPSATPAPSATVAPTVAPTEVPSATPVPSTTAAPTEEAAPAATTQSASPAPTEEAAPAATTQSASPAPTTPAPTASMG